MTPKSDIEPDEPRASFHAMADGTREDWQIIFDTKSPFPGALPGRMLNMLHILEGDTGGYAVNRLEHSLQSATRAFRDGRDEEYVVCALLHDIGDILGPHNHAEVAAVLLKPFVSEQNHWMLDKHGVLQGYHFFHHLGLDRNMREQFRSHPHFAHTLEFCDLYDQNCFDPAYDSMPLDAFEPMLRRVMAAPKRSIYRGDPA
jgi:predicted HD phosphohydrolase